MGKNSLVLGVALGVVAGLTAGWLLGSRQTDRDILDSSLVHQLDTIALCAGALNSWKVETPDKVRQLLEDRMRSSLSEAKLIMNNGISLNQPIPNLREGVRRAVKYAEHETVSPTLRREANDVLEQLIAQQGRDASQESH